MSCDLSRLAVDFGHVWCWFWSLLFKLLTYQMAHSPNSHGPLPASFSQHPTPAFFQLYCKQSTFANRRLGAPCVTLGWPLGDAWVTQSQSQSQSGRGSQAVFIYPITKLPIYPILLRYRRKPAICSTFIFQRASRRTAHPQAQPDYSRFRRANQ
jgi:hypothetical protein